jgi:hypothetical protein
VTERIMYIEQKSGLSDYGPAWIGLAQFSKSGKTIYFNNQSFKSIGGRGISGNYSDFLTGDEYWISGVKKDGSDRHWAGGGRVMVQEEITEQYLSIIGCTELDLKKYEIVSVEPTDKQKFAEIENEVLEEELDPTELRHKEIHKLTKKELDFMIEEYEYSIQTIKFNKARRSYQKYLNELIEEKEKRAITY